MVIEFHSGMSSSGKLYGFGLPLACVFFSADFAESLDAADSGTAADELAVIVVFVLPRTTDELKNSVDELVCCAEEFVCERVVVVSIIKLICALFFCGKDSVNEFIGEKCFSDTLSAAAENAQKIAMINKILRYML